MKRLVGHFLNRSLAPRDLLEDDRITSDVSVYMGFLFEAGYPDFDSNSRKLLETLAAAISQHLSPRECRYLN